jgi:hypothetical protein
LQFYNNLPDSATILGPFLIHLQSNFFHAKFFFCILEKGILAGKKLLCKEDYSFFKFPILFQSIQRPSKRQCIQPAFWARRLWIFSSRLPSTIFQCSITIRKFWRLCVELSIPRIPGRKGWDQSEFSYFLFK